LGSAALLAGCGDDNSSSSAKSPAAAATAGGGSSPAPGASASAAAGQAKKGGTLRLPVIFASGHFDVQMFVPGAYTSAVWRACANGVFTLDPKTGDPIPDIIKDYSFPDPLTL